MAYWPQYITADIVTTDIGPLHTNGRYKNDIDDVTVTVEMEKFSNGRSLRQAEALRLHLRLRQGLHRQEDTQEAREDEASCAVEDVVAKFGLIDLGWSIFLMSYWGTI